MDFKNKNEKIFKEIESLISNNCEEEQYLNLYERLIEIDFKCWTCSSDLKTKINEDKEFLREIKNLKNMESSNEWN